VETGWLKVSDRSRKSRAHRLSATYRQNNGNFKPKPEPPGALPGGFYL
jgi:hypothetical protein